MEKVIYNKTGDKSKDNSIIEDFVDYVILYEDQEWLIREMIEKGIHTNPNAYFISRSLLISEKGNLGGEFEGGFSNIENFRNYPSESILFPQVVTEVVEEYFESLMRFK